MAQVPTLVATPKMTPMSFVNADGTTKKTVATAGTSGSKVVALICSSTDTASHVVNVWLTRSATSYLIGSATVPIAAGSDGVTATTDLWGLLNVLPRDNDGQRYLFLENGDTLQVSMAVAVTAAKEVDVLAIFGNF